MTNDTRKRRFENKANKRGDNREEDKEEKIWDDRWSWELRMRNEDEENKKNKWQMNRETKIKNEINKNREKTERRITEGGLEMSGGDEEWKIRNGNEDEKNKW